MSADSLTRPETTAARTYSEREKVLAERSAFKEGVAFIRSCLSEFSSDWVDEMHRRYPLPRVEKPRVMPDPEQGFDQKWRYVDGRLEFCCFTKWRTLESLTDDRHTCTTPTPKRLALWADLAANPTELVVEDV